MLSYSIASDLVERSIDQWTFEENEKRILKLLSFKLNPFTLWNEMNMILEGFEQFIEADEHLDWKQVQNKALWVTEGCVMLKSYKLKKSLR